MDMPALLQAYKQENHIANLQAAGACVGVKVAGACVGVNKGKGSQRNITDVTSSK